MFFPDTIYEKDLPADVDTRQLAMSLAPGRCDAAVWSDSEPGSMRLISTDSISIDRTGQWNGFEDFFYNNPGLLAPMSKTTVLVETDSTAIVPASLQRDVASRLLRMSATESGTQCTETWHDCCGASVGLLLPSRLFRLINRSFQPVEIRWYASPIATYWSETVVAHKAGSPTPLHALAAVSPAMRLTVVVVDNSGNLVSAISRKGSVHTDLSYHILSLLSSLAARSSVRDQVSLRLFGAPKEITAIKEELSGWIDAELHTYISRKPSLTDPTQFHLLPPELLAAIDQY